jgi:hypothetical protein
MRWNEVQLLIESVAKYRPMFNMFRNADDPAQEKNIDNLIRYSEQLFKREDRVVWALRWTRINLYLNATKGEAGDPTVWKKITRDLTEQPVDDAVIHGESQNFENMISTFQHLFAMQVPKLHNFVFQKQLPSEIVATLREFEKEWQEEQAKKKQVIDHTVHYPKKDEDEYDDDDDDDDEYDMYGDRKEKVVYVYGDIEEMINFGNGWVWFDLNRAFCDREGSAMGHCGNAAAHQDGDRVLSLRKQIEGDKWRPSLTFILHEDGWLGEMKGRANQKPKAEYHDMIVALLKHEEIRGIDGGGYAPGNNFSIFDLPEERRNELLKLKPNLLSPEDAMQQYRENSSPETLERLEVRVKAALIRHGMSFLRLDHLHESSTLPSIVIGEKPLEKWLRWNDDEKIMALKGLFDEEELREEFVAQGMSLSDASHLAQDAEAAYYMEVLAKLIPRSTTYILEGVWDELLGDDVVTSMSIHSALNPSFADGSFADGREPEEDNIYDDLSSLDQENHHSYGDYYTWQDIRDDYDSADEVVALIAEYCYERSDKMVGLIGEKIINQLSDKPTNYFSRHPDQLRLNLGDDAAS